MRIAIGGVTIALACGAGSAPAQERPVYPDPTRFEAAIAAFEAADAEAPPAAGEIVAVGSSSMRGWQRRIREDLAPLSVLPRGFGGSTMYDVLHHLDRVVLAYRPRAVLLYEGDNDVAAGISPDRIRATFDSLTARIHARQPWVRIYVISVKPSIARWHLWPQMAETNRLLRGACDQDGRLTFIDVATQMLGQDGRPRPELFVDDQLHMTDVGYDIWATTVGPELRRREEVFEEPYSWTGADRLGVFESGIPPGEYGGRFRTPAAAVPLYHAPTARAGVVRTVTMPPGELEYDEVRYRTLKPGLLVAREAGELRGSNYGRISYLSRGEYYGFGGRRERFDFSAGDTIVFLQYRAELTCFVRRGTDVLNVKLGQARGALEQVGRAETELWIHLVDEEGEGLGWYRIPHGSIARFEEPL